MTLALACLLLAGAAACGGAPAAGGSAETPTTGPLFAAVTHNPLPYITFTATAPPAPQGSTPTPAPVFIYKTPLPTRTLRPTLPPPTPAPTLSGDVLTSTITTTTAYDLSAYPLAYIFEDDLAPGWSIDNSWDVLTDHTDRTYVHSGFNSLAVTPQKDFAALFATVVSDTQQAYLRENVLGLRIWINPGDRPIHLDQLAVTVLGSNDYAYWRKDDQSVKTEKVVSGQPQFSETRLYFLDFNRPLPADTWVEIIVWLDRLIYDPEYTYVTGFYIKNDAGFRNIYSIDDVALIMLPGSGPTPIDQAAAAGPAGEPTPAPTGAPAASPTP